MVGMDKLGGGLYMTDRTAIGIGALFGSYEKKIRQIEQ